MRWGAYKWAWGVGDTDDVAMVDCDTMKSSHPLLPYGKIGLFVNPVN